ncbi:pyruvate kinase, partial [Nitrospirales bacterium NOB]|nr:pyruvate kinase [Nitrospirales bacterium NOB]
MRKAKIVCTIGPASDGPAVLEQLIQSGMNAVRLNFSHGTHESHGRAIKAVREQAERQGVAVAVIQDLQGPRLRVGEIPGGVTLVAGQVVR